MSVEIKVGDTVKFNHLKCYILLHKLYEEAEFCTKEIPVDLCISATIILIHRDDGFGDGYVLLQRVQPFTRDNQIYMIRLYDLLNSPYTIVNSVPLMKPTKCPNKWTEFAGDSARKVPKALDDVMYGRTALPDYKALIKKYIPIKRRVYLWACNAWRNLVG